MTRIYITVAPFGEETLVLPFREPYISIASKKLRNRLGGTVTFYDTKEKINFSTENFVGGQYREIHTSLTGVVDGYLKLEEL